MGRAASPELENLRQLGLQGAVPADTQQSDLWRSTLVALGASTAEFALPREGERRIDDYREDLRRSADNGCKPD